MSGQKDGEGDANFGNVGGILIKFIKLERRHLRSTHKKRGKTRKFTKERIGGISGFFGFLKGLL